MEPITTEYYLKMNVGKTRTMRISRNLHINIRIKFNATIIKEVNKFIHLRSEVTSGKIGYGESNRRI
jgi:hypothetical protein